MSSGYEKALLRAMARRCGLEDPDAFAARARTHGEHPRYAELDLGERFTGRTTRMLLAAIVALEAGCDVEIVMANEADAEAAAGMIDALRERAGSPDRGTVRYGLRVSYVGCGPKTPRNIDVRLVDHAAMEDTGG